jgi:hypothetical protein
LKPDFAPAISGNAVILSSGTFKRQIASAICIGIMALPIGDARAEEPVPPPKEILSVLSYNVHGLFALIAKGYLRIRIETPSGATIDVYNTHLESGPSDESTVVRGKQLQSLAEAIERTSRGGAVIVAGDCNLAYIRPGDRKVFKKFRKRLGMSDSGAGPETPFWRERDFILYRSGSETPRNGADCILEALRQPPTVNRVVDLLDGETPIANVFDDL